MKIDKYILAAFGLGLGLGMSSFFLMMFGNYLRTKEKILAEAEEETLLNDDSVDVKDYLKWKEKHKF